jgi:hypothetical protein
MCTVACTARILHLDPPHSYPTRKACIPPPLQALLSGACASSNTTQYTVASLAPAPAVFEHLLAVCELWQHCKGLVPVPCQHTVLEVTGMLRLHLDALHSSQLRKHEGGVGGVFGQYAGCWGASNQHGEVLNEPRGYLRLTGVTQN